MSIDNGGPAFPVEFIDEHLERVLRAAGSSLRHYKVPKYIQAMREAMADAMLAARGKSHE